LNVQRSRQEKNQRFGSDNRISHPKGNADTERFMRTFKEEIIYPNEYNSLEEAKKTVEDFITFYNWDYPHSALGYLSPIDFEKQLTYKNAV